MKPGISIKWVIIVVIMSNIVISALSIYAASNWLFTINGKAFLTTQDLDADYDINIDVQALFRPQFTENVVKLAKNDKKQKELYIDSIINDYLIMEEAKEQGIFDEQLYNRKAQLAGRLIKRKLIKNLYIKKVLFNQIQEVDETLVEHYYEQLQADKRIKSWPPRRKRQRAEYLAKFQEAQKQFILTLERLRSQKKIKTNIQTDNKEYGELFD